MAARVWDAFLSERDRQDVADHPTPEWGLGSAPALVLIDLYRKAFGDGPDDEEARRRGACGPAAWAALPHLQTLLAAAREAAIPVVHVTGVTEIPRWSDPLTDVAGSRGTGIGSPERRRAYRIVPELEPVDGEVVLAKAGPSAFFGTPLAAYLTRYGVDSVIVGGESTSGCVRASVVDARSHQLRVTVVEECVFDRHEAPHAINLFDMDRKYADVVSLADAQERLRNLGRPT